MHIFGRISLVQIKSNLQTSLKHTHTHQFISIWIIVLFEMSQHKVYAVVVSLLLLLSLFYVYVSRLGLFICIANLNEFDHVSYIVKPQCQTIRLQVVPPLSLFHLLFLSSAHYICYAIKNVRQLICSPLFFFFYWSYNNNSVHACVVGVLYHCMRICFLECKKIDVVARLCYSNKIISEI